MDEIQEKMVGMEEEASVVKDLYDLMEKYQVPVSPEDHAVYQVRAKLGVHLTPMCTNYLYTVIIVNNSACVYLCTSMWTVCTY